MPVVEADAEVEEEAAVNEDEEVGETLAAADGNPILPNVIAAVRLEDKTLDQNAGTRIRFFAPCLRSLVEGKV